MSNILDAIAFVGGLIIAIIIDVIVFDAIAAIPLAALMYLGVISRGIAIGMLIGVTIIVTVRILLVGATKALSR